MNFKPHNRRSIRIKDYNYSNIGMYFVTICVQNKAFLFGDIVDNEMILSDIGETVKQCWLNIPSHFPNVKLHNFIVMPNHIHGIIEIFENGNVDATVDNVSTVGANDYSPYDINQRVKNDINQRANDIPQRANDINQRANINSPLQNTNETNNQPNRPKGTSKTLGSIVRGFKIGVIKQIHENGFIGPMWQRNYYEHIIRDEEDYINISNYIKYNPVNWEKDKLNVIVNKNIGKNNRSIATVGANNYSPLQTQTNNNTVKK